MPKISKGFDGSESSAVEISICAVDIPVVVFPLVAFSISAVLKTSAFAVALSVFVPSEQIMYRALGCRIRNP